MTDRQNIKVSPLPRTVSFYCLMEIFEQEQFVHLVLKKKLAEYGNLENRDRAFITRLVNGTVEQKIYLDYVINQFSKIKADKMKPVIRTILRMSVYQIFFMDGVSDWAVCDEAVKLAKKEGLSGLSGFVNGVLRNLCRKKDNIVLPDKDSSPAAYLSVKYSMPEWIVNRFVRIFGRQEAERIFDWYLHSDALWVRCNTSKKSVEEILTSLKQQGIKTEVSPLLHTVLRLYQAGSLEEIEAFRLGYIQVQDISSAIASFICPVNPGDYIIDVCAAPGGKSLHFADRLNGTGMVEARDLTAEKVARIEENITRTGFDNIRAQIRDALCPDEEAKEKADIVVADLPCSGLGIIGKKPDIKYHVVPEQIDGLACLQKQILSVVQQYVKPGGMLVYSTCTVTPEENEDNADWFLRQFDFEEVSFDEYLCEELKGKAAKRGRLQLIPGKYGTDGFFIALFRKKGGSLS